MVGKRSMWSRLARFARWTGVALVVAASAATVSSWKAMGQRPSGERLARMQRSPQWKDGRFVNPQPLVNDMLGAVGGALGSSPFTSPKEPVPVAPLDPRTLKEPPASGLRVTWLGHSTFYLEIEGHRVLTDPVWSPRASPLGFVGPKRWYPPLIALQDLPRPDVVVISHDHYDHLDLGTILQMKDWETTFVVPLGVGAHLEYWGIPASRVVELDWWERTRVRDLEIAATPARHASGRTFAVGQDSTLWAGFAFLGKERRAWYSGDTGLFPALRDIGEKLGPFDVTLIESGAYARWWPDWHLGPEQAVRAHQLVRGKVLVPAHWGLLTLAYHAWTEPIERVLAAAGPSQVTVAAPRPGQPVEPTTLTDAGLVARWWPELATQRAEQDPIVSSGMELVAGGTP